MLKRAVKNKQELDPSSGKKKRVNSRSKGFNCERKYAKTFREAGFSHCKTTREASRMLDDCKVDLAFLPILPQIKKGYDRFRPKPEKIFKEMRASLSENFPEDDPIHKKPRVLIHEIDGRCEENCLVTMTFNDWFEMFKGYEELKKLKSKGGLND